MYLTDNMTDQTLTCCSENNVMGKPNTEVLCVCVNMLNKNVQEMLTASYLFSFLLLTSVPAFLLDFCFQRFILRKLT